MHFDSQRDAVKWLDSHPDCQKATFIDCGDGAFIGDRADLPGVTDDWLEVSYRQLVRQSERELDEAARADRA